MKHIKWLLLLAAALLSASFPPPALAGEDPAVIQTYIQDNTAGLFVSKALPDGEPSCLVSSTPSRARIYGTVEGKSIPVNTYVLIDVSTSIRQGSRDFIGGVLEDMIDRKEDRNALAVYTFGEEVRALCDLSRDRYQLSKAMEALEYKDESSDIYKAVRQVAELAGKNRESGPALYQLVIFTDGVEASKEGITSDELFFFLKRNPLPIHTVGFEYENNGDAIKLLSSMARMTNGESFAVRSNEADRKIPEALERYGEGLTLITVDLPEELQDGSSRQIEVSYSGGKISHELKMPQMAAAPKTEPESKPELKPQAPIVTEPKPEPEPAGFPVWAIAAIAAGAVILLSGIAVPVIVARRKKREPAGEQNAPPTPESGEATRFVNEGGGETLALLPQVAGKSGAKLVLIDLAHPNRRFEVLVEDFIVIGRDAGKCTVVLDYDKTVSREQCKITRHESYFIVKNVSRTNMTILNDQPLTAPTTLQDKDVLTCGKTKLAATIAAF